MAGAARPGLDEVERSCRRLVRRQALKAAGMSALPVAGVDLFVNGSLLAATLQHISAAYGLAPEQLAALPPPLRSKVDELRQDIGSYFIGRVVTRRLLLVAAKAMGLRLTAQQAAKLAPLVGLAASAAMSGWMFKTLCDRHLAQCKQVRAALPQLPATRPQPRALLLPAPAA